MLSNVWFRFPAGVLFIFLGICALHFAEAAPKCGLECNPITCHGYTPSGGKTTYYEYQTLDCGPCSVTGFSNCEQLPTTTPNCVNSTLEQFIAARTANDYCGTVDGGQNQAQNCAGDQQ